MKPRRVPSKAEKVYTYTLDRTARKKHHAGTSVADVEVPINEHLDVTRNEQPEPKKREVETAPEKEVEEVEPKRPDKRKHEIFAWAESDDEMDAFYDEMQQHEVGDPQLDQKHGLPHKTHYDKTPLFAKGDFLNVDTDDSVPVQKMNDREETEAIRIADFLEGDINDRFYPGNPA